MNSSSKVAWRYLAHILIVGCVNVVSVDFRFGEMTEANWLDAVNKEFH